MSNQPLVSIIIPTYNRAHLIGETLDSVLAQSYLHWECLVIDDGSTDDTETLINSYQTKDARFQYYKRPNTHLSGGNGARNYGFEISRGDYIQWLDADDLLSENKILGQINKTQSNSKCDLVTSKWARYKSCNNINIKNEEPFYNNYSNSLNLIEDLGKVGGLFPAHVYLVKRGVIEKSGLWDECLSINQDGEFFCRVIINSECILFFEEGIAYYRMHQLDNTSLINSYNRAEQRIKSWRMINNHLKFKFGENNSSYVLKGKVSCFKKIKRHYPFLIIKNVLFFRREIISYLHLKIKNI